MLDALSGLLTSGAAYIIGFLFVLTLIVFVHEMGHFLVARWCGVTVSTFSIGFGKELWGWEDKHGTRWRVAAIPLGGYVKFLDDANAASGGPNPTQDLSSEDQPGAFHTKPVWKRAAVVAAGPLANFIFAAVIYAILNMTVGVRIVPARVDEVVAQSPADKAGIRPGDMITAIDGWPIESYDEVYRLVTTSSGRELAIDVDRSGERLAFNVMPQTIEQKADLGVMMRLGDIGIRRVIPAKVGQVLPASPAEGAGIQAGDAIVAIDGQPVSTFQDIVKVVTPAFEKKIVFTIDRAGQRIDVPITPQRVSGKDKAGKVIHRGRVGIAPVLPQPQAVSGLEAVRLGVRETYANIMQTVVGIVDIFAGRQSADQVGGPLLMAEVSGRVIAHGIEPLLRWTALISANIGLLNLLPVPVLDGGHLVFYAIEAIRRKPLSQRAQEFSFQVGMALILFLVVFVNLNDLMRIGKRLFGDW